MLRYDPYEVLMLTILQGKGNGGLIGTIGVALSIDIYPKIVKDIATHTKKKYPKMSCWCWQGKGGGVIGGIGVAGPRVAKYHKIFNYTNCLSQLEMTKCSVLHHFWVFSQCLFNILQLWQVHTALLYFHLSIDTFSVFVFIFVFVFALVFFNSGRSTAPHW